MIRDRQSLKISKAVATVLREVQAKNGIAQSRIAAEIGVSRATIASYLSGRTVPSAQVLAMLSARFGVAFDLGSVTAESVEPTERVDVNVDELFLRSSRARNQYVCALCQTVIPVGALYFRHEPHPLARYHRGVPVRHFCQSCVGVSDQADAPHAIGRGEGQFALAFGTKAVVEPTRVENIDITPLLVRRILADPDEVFRIGARELELLVMNRLEAMGLEASRIGDTYRRDGGIDLMFWPPKGSTIPFLGAAQVKHHRHAHIKTGSPVIRDFVGALAQQPFAVGLIVTNTSFTADACWFAAQRPGLLRLRDMDDLRRWLLDNFTDEAEWREVPRSIELGPGLIVEIPR